MKKVALILGTRPEAIKLAPLIKALQESKHFTPFVISTGQHREMLRQVFGWFGVKPDIDLDLMEPNQTLNWYCHVNSWSMMHGVKGADAQTFLHL